MKVLQYFDVRITCCTPKGYALRSDGLRAMLAVAYATGRVTHARQVKGDDPDKKGYPGPSGWEFGVGLTTSPSKKTYCYESRAKEKAG